MKTTFAFTGTGATLSTLAPLLCLLLALPAAVPAAPAEDFTYITNNGTITITDYTGPGGDVTIPDTIHDLPVTAIGDSAFYRCATLTNVTMGNSVTTIGQWAFLFCVSLRSVTIGSSVTNIGNAAFGYCSSLTTVAIPDSVTAVGEGAFADCLSLTAFEVGPLNSAYSSLDGVLFDKSRSTLIQCPGAKSGGYMIPESVTGIGDTAFRYCASLTSVTIPDSVTTIGTEAFSGCTGLTNVTIGNGVTTIGDSAFYRCTNLPTVTIPASVTTIGESAFDRCTSLTAVEVDPLNSVYSSVDGVLLNKAQTLVIQCPGAKPGNFTIPASVTTIGESAFYRCTNLTRVTIPNRVTRIGNGAFSGCTGLTNVTIGSSVTTIESDAFKSCTRLTAVYFKGIPPSAGASIFDGAIDATVYHLPGTAGWGSVYAGRLTAHWHLPAPVILGFGASFGVLTNGFGFIVSWATNAFVLIEASTNVAAPTWDPVDINVPTDGWFYFSDPYWTNHPARFYRLWSP